MGRQENRERDQEIDNLCEKLMMENFPNLVMETDIQVQEAQSQTRWTQRDPHQDTS